VPAWVTTVRYDALAIEPTSQVEGLGEEMSVYKKGEGPTYTQDGVLADQLDLRVSDAALSIALTVGLDVAKVTDVAVIVAGAAVALAVGVDYGINQYLVSCIAGLSEAEPTVRLSRPLMRGWSRGGAAYSEGRRWCSHWYCHRTGGYGSHARRWRRGRRCRR
jgi:hypothetical protein